MRLPLSLFRLVCVALSLSLPLRGAQEAAGSESPSTSELPGGPLDAQVSPAATEADEAPSFPDSWLVLDGIDGRGRRPFRPDRVFTRHLWIPGLKPPVAGQSLTGEKESEQSWSRFEVAADSASVASSGWAYTVVQAESPRIVLAKLSGASTLFVNGAAFVGDVYRFGFGGVPIALVEGANHLYVNGIRGSFELKLEEVAPGVSVASWDATLPDVARGESLPKMASVLVLNAAASTSPPVRVALVPESAADSIQPPLGATWKLPPLSVVKLPAAMRVPRGFRTPSGESMTWRSLLTVLPEEADGGGDLAGDGPSPAPSPAGSGADSASFDVAMRARGATHRRTHRSRIDRSIQKWAWVPPSELRPAEQGRGLILSLHGAGVTSLGQALCYAPKLDFWIAAPTNRRPFGFDWQDWGRIDAYEVLDLARKLSGVVDERLYLTGHSMGGHGTWHLAANDPDRFAAIAPSAGWESFDTYGGRPDGTLRELWHRADAASLTNELMPNLAQVPSFVLHGTDDETVSRAEADRMLAALEESGGQPEHHFQEGAGHWWGNACVDFPAITDFFREHRRARDPLRVDFITVDPLVDSDHYWLTAQQPREYGRPMRLAAEFDPRSKVLTIETANAGAFRVRPPETWDIARFEIDGRKFEALGVRDRGAFRYVDGGWRRGAPGIEEKSPLRSGPFKRAFDHGFVLVYGTAGTAQETAQLLERARYDAQVWWYRGNGLGEVVADLDFDPQLEPDRNVILYGNRSTNYAWDLLLSESPIVADRGRLRVGEQVFEGETLGAVFVFPRDDSQTRLVGAFADTGVAGTRLGYTLAPFVSGVGYPDFAVFDARVLAEGDGGVVAAGWFDRNWELPGGWDAEWAAAPESVAPAGGDAVRDSR